MCQFKLIWLPVPYTIKNTGSRYYFTFTKLKPVLNFSKHIGTALVPVPVSDEICNGTRRLSLYNGLQTVQAEAASTSMSFLDTLWSCIWIYGAEFGCTVFPDPDSLFESR
jgi:hypothetical protein